MFKRSNWNIFKTWTVQVGRPSWTDFDLNGLNKKAIYIRMSHPIYISEAFCPTILNEKGLDRTGPKNCTGQRFRPESYLLRPDFSSTGVQNMIFVYWKFKSSNWISFSSDQTSDQYFFSMRRSKMLINSSPIKKIDLACESSKTVIELSASLGLTGLQSL